MFGRKKSVSKSSNSLPPDTAERMLDFGQFEFNPTGSDLDGEYVWEHLQSPYLAAAQSDPNAFISELAALVLPVGGWVKYGAHRTVASLIGPETQHRDYHLLVDAALIFLRSEGVSLNHFNAYEQRFWLQNHGQS